MKALRLRSLRSRIFVAFVGLLIVLEALVAVSAHWIIHQNIDSGSNRIMLGSLKTVTLAFSHPEPMRTEIMPIALKLLQRRARPITHYSIYSGDRFIEGLREISPPQGREQKLHVRSILGQPLAHMSEYVDPGDGEAVVTPAYIRTGSFRGERARIAAEVRRVPGFAEPVIIQIAIQERILNAGERESLTYVSAAAALTLLLGVIFAWHASRWAVRPFTELQAQIEARGGREDFRFRPLERAPQEASTFITAFNALLAELKESALAVKRFTAEASHQMRTPLAVLRTHLDLVRRYGVNSNAGQEGLADMGDAIGNLERLLLQLIALARAEEGSGQADFAEPFDLAAVAAAAAADRFDQARAAGVELALEATNGEVVACGHASLCREMVGNLIDNAIRYNAAGGAVAVRVTGEAGLCRLEVMDDGPGIPAEARSLIFDRFYRLPRDADQSGSGLGLPIVRALADRMSANVRLEDGDQGRGLNVVVEFRSAGAETALRPPRDGPRAPINFQP